MSIDEIIALSAAALVVLALTNCDKGEYNTEAVCYQDGVVVDYASGYKPDDQLILAGDCKYSWGVRAPKGKLYYEEMAAMSNRKPSGL